MLQLNFSNWFLRVLISGLIISLLQAPIYAKPLENLPHKPHIHRNLKAPMALLHIALQEGFFNDSVIIRANRQEIFRRQSVKTRTQIGLAEWMEINLPEGSVTLEVSVPSKGVTQSIPLQLSGNVYLGISLTPEGKLNYQISNQAFGYL